MKTIKECLKELNKLKFSLEYKISTPKWNLIIFDENLEIKEDLKNDYNSFKKNNRELSFKDYSAKKIIFINEILKRIENND